MPIYEYECRECGQVHEIMQKMSDSPLTTCPHCSGKLQKLISHSTFHLKGSGWYATDYAKRNSGPASTQQAQTSEKAADKSTATSDSSTPANSSDD